jgi:FkbM family methyltransferase
MCNQGREAPLGIWEGLKWYRELCGVTGVAAIASKRLLGKPKVLHVKPRGSKHSVQLRIDTSDFCAYCDVLTFETKSYDPQIGGFAPKTIVDIGAHIGMASIFFALKYPMARIVAVEPESSNFAALVRNTAPYEKITPVRAAIWREDGFVSIGPSNMHVKGAFEIVENGPERVRAVTMSTLMGELGLDTIDLLKMDIEGAELEVFESCPWINHVRVIAIELHDRVRHGCGLTIYKAATNFRSYKKGEITFFFHQDHHDSLTDGSAAPGLSAA